MAKSNIVQEKPTPPAEEEETKKSSSKKDSKKKKTIKQIDENDDLKENIQSETHPNNQSNIMSHEFYENEIVDFEFSNNHWVDGIILAKRNNRVKIESLNPKRSAVWLEINCDYILKQWQQSWPRKHLKVNNRIAILDKKYLGQLSEGSQQFNMFYEARIIEFDKDRKQIHVTYSPRHPNLPNEWLQIQSHRIKPICSLQDQRLAQSRIQFASKSFVIHNKTIFNLFFFRYGFDADSIKLFTFIKNKKFSIKEERFKKELLDRGLQVNDMVADGNCLFRSVADQIYGKQSLHGQIRKFVVQYLEIEKDYFFEFISADSIGKNRRGAAGLSNSAEIERDLKAEEKENIWKSYVQNISKDRTWGDDIEIQIISEIYQRNVEIYNAYSITPMRTFHELTHDFSSKTKPNPPIRLSYQGQCHYDSINTTSTQQAYPPLGSLEELVINQAIERQKVLNNIEGDNMEIQRDHLNRNRANLFDMKINTEEMYDKYISEQIEKHQQEESEETAKKMEQSIQTTSMFHQSLLSETSHSDLAMELALQESKYLAEQQQQSNASNNKNQSNLTGENQLEQAIMQMQINETSNEQKVLEAVVLAGFSMDQARSALDVVGCCNEEALISFICEYLI